MLQKACLHPERRAAILPQNVVKGGSVDCLGDMTSNHVGLNDETKTWRCHIGFASISFSRDYFLRSLQILTWTVHRTFFDVQTGYACQLIKGLGCDASSKCFSIMPKPTLNKIKISILKYTDAINNIVSSHWAMIKCVTVHGRIIAFMGSDCWGQPLSYMTTIIKLLMAHIS